MTSRRLLNIALFIAFLFCYVDWGHGGAEFIFQAQIDIFSKLTTQPDILLSPLILFPLLGQGFLLLATFPKNINTYRQLTNIGLLCLTFIVLLITGMSLFTSKWVSFITTIPYLLLAVIIIIKQLPPKSVD